jgi:hypothetical protein
MAFNIIPNDSDSEQLAEPAIPLYPDLSSNSPGNPDLDNLQVFLIGSLAISHLLTGNPPLSSFSIPDLISSGRRLWRWYIAASYTRRRQE